MRSQKVLVVGASAGGVRAVQDLFGWLRADLNIPIVVVLHIGRNPAVDYHLIYGNSFKGEIFDILDKMPLLPNQAYFAPADYHVYFERGHSLALGQEEPVHFARPSIDVAFSSAAETLGTLVCGVLLTGGNQDGAAGLKEIREAGGLTLVQDPKNAEFPIMPRSALDLFTPDAILDLKGIANRVNIWAKGETV